MGAQTLSPLHPDGTPSDCLDLPAADASVAADQLKHLLSLSEAERVRFAVLDGVGSGAVSVVIPRQALEWLMGALNRNAAGQAVQTAVTSNYITTQQAARFLGVSRPFIVSEIEAGRLDCVKVGRHRGLTMEQLMEYRKKHINVDD